LDAEPEGLATFYRALTPVSWRLAALCKAFLLEKSRALAKLVAPALQVEESEAGGGVIVGDGKNTSGNSRPLTRL
jgi:hypothetical protein